MEPIQFIDFEFIDKICEFNQIYTFRFKHPENFSFQGGQWIHIGFPGIKKDKTLVRHMSFASAPEDEYIEFTMDLSSKTPFKIQMGAMQAGDIMKGFKLRGEFTVSEDISKKVVFLSGGIGITPVRSIIRHLNYRQSEVDWKLLHVSRDRFLYEKEFNQYPNSQWRTNRAGLNTTLDHVCKQNSEAYFYISGSENFVTGMLDQLKNKAITDQQIITESFH